MKRQIFTREFRRKGDCPLFLRLNDDQALRILKSVDISDSLKVVVVNNYGQGNLSEDEYSNNLYCVEGGGVIVWQVVAPKNRHGNDAFTYIKFLDGKLIAKKESGTKYVLDEKTGVAIEVGFEK